MLLVNLFSMILRLAELAFAAIVAGINGHYLHQVEGTSTWDQARFIYTEVVAGISIIAAIIWLFPFAGSFIHWPIDLLISVCWWVSFGLLVDYLNGSCGYVFFFFHNLLSNPPPFSFLLLTGTLQKRLRLDWDPSPRRERLCPVESYYCLCLPIGALLAGFHLPRGLLGPQAGFSRRRPRAPPPLVPQPCLNLNGKSPPVVNVGN